MKIKHIILITIASLLLLLLLFKLLANGFAETTFIREYGFSISESRQDGLLLEILKTSPDTLHFKYNDLIIEECWIQCTYRVNYKWIFIREQVIQNEDLLLSIKPKIVGDSNMTSDNIFIRSVKPNYGYFGWIGNNSYSIYRKGLDSLFKDTLHCRVKIDLWFIENNENYNINDTTSQLLLIFPPEK